MALLVEIKKKLRGFTLQVGFETSTLTTGLLGPSGCGKSMTLRCIAGLDKPDSGRIILNGRTLFDSDKGFNLPSRDRKVGFLFQNYALFPHMTVSENIGFGMATLSPQMRKSRTNELLSAMHLNHMSEHFPFELSGGQQQRVALARALVMEPEIMLLDEPFSALDNHMKNHMTDLLLDGMRNFTGHTLYVSHDMDEAYRICKQFVVLCRGSVDAIGSRELFYECPPTLLSAQLTGYKNFTSIRPVSPNSVEALDWGIMLKTVKPLHKAAYIGIHPEHIRMASSTELSNIVTCSPISVREAPFSIMLKLSIHTKKGPGSSLECELPKDYWDSIKERPLPWRIYLDPAKLVVIAS